MLKYLFFISFVFISLFFETNSETQITKNTHSSEKIPNELHIYLLIGQSNMAGRAEISGSDSDTLENVFLYTGITCNDWEKAANPLNKYSTIRKDLSMQKLGPGYHFAKKMLELNNENSIGLVVNAKGGTSITEWEPGSFFYNEAVKRTKDAMNYGILKGILWHQGESDVSAFETYTSKIVKLIEAFRTDFILPGLPVVVGQLSEDKTQRVHFNKMILQLPLYIEHVGVVKTENTNTTDSTHFNGESQRLLGERYALEMYRLLNL